MTNPQVKITPAMPDEEFLRTLVQAVAGEVEVECDHTCHLRLAWLNLRNKPWPIALADTCEVLKALPEHSGGGRAYHHTLTVASLRLILQRIKHHDNDDFESFLAAYPELRADFRELIKNYYSDEHLERRSARVAFVSPDKRALDG